MSHDVGLCGILSETGWDWLSVSKAIPATISKGNIMTTSVPAQQPVAAAISAISQQQHDAARSCGNRWGHNKLERLEIAGDYARSLGTDPTFPEWEAHRIDWVNGYVEANPNNSGNAADAAWSDFAKVLGDLYALVKPKSSSAAATKKSGERAKKEEQLLAKYQGKSAADLRGMRSAALQKAAAGSDLAEKIATELKKVLRVVTREENQAIGEERKELRAQVKTAAAKCTDLDKLRAALEILDEDSELEFVTLEEEYAEDPAK
jgi:hypothetical protein